MYSKIQYGNLWALTARNITPWNSTFSEFGALFAYFLTYSNWPVAEKARRALEIFAKMPARSSKDSPKINNVLHNHKILLKKI